MLFIAKPAKDALGNHLTDIRHNLQLLERHIRYLLESSKMLCEITCGFLADLRDAERDEESRKRDTFAGGDRFHKILCGELGKSLKPDEISGLEKSLLLST